MPNNVFTGQDAVREVRRQEVVKLLRRLYQRTTGMHAAIINATRNADRITIANSMDSWRLDLDAAIELLTEED